MAMEFVIFRVIISIATLTGCHYQRPLHHLTANMRNVLVVASRGILENMILVRVVRFIKCQMVTLLYVVGMICPGATHRAELHPALFII